MRETVLVADAIPTLSWSDPRTKVLRVWLLQLRPDQVAEFPLARVTLRQCGEASNGTRPRPGCQRGRDEHGTSRRQRLLQAPFRFASSQRKDRRIANGTSPIAAIPTRSCQEITAESPSSAIVCKLGSDVPIHR